MVFLQNTPEPVHPLTWALCLGRTELTFFFFETDEYWALRICLHRHKQPTKNAQCMNRTMKGLQEQGIASGFEGVFDGSSEWKPNFRLYPSRRKLRTIAYVCCETNSRKQQRSEEQACAAMLLAAKFQTGPAGKLGSSRVLIPTEERFWGRGESICLQGMDSI